jgi:MFS transporter, Spinster family, sphingosine-1-phosphate transporter
LNIFIVHLLGDAISPPFIGALRDRWSMNVGLLAASGMILVGGILWLWGAKFLARDTEAVEAATNE